MNVMKSLSIALCALSLLSCSSKGTNGNTSEEQSQPAIQAQVQFNQDSAYALVKQQCDFGPRVPGTDAHKQCGAWIKARLSATCDQVIEQNPELTTFDGHTFTAANFIGVINPQAQQRLLLLAHWDCRPWADADPDSTKHHEPVMGANDAASGVAVLLEVARQLKAKKPTIGVDILITDLEDWGTDDKEDSWALGTQYWVAHRHVAGYQPMAGVLLDMVGARGATFQQEVFSLQSAQSFVDQVWALAEQSGYGNYFKTTQGGAVTDDHVTLNRHGIPCIDIIDLRAGSQSGFFSGWHTTHDTLDQIDPATLKAVGQTVCNLIFSY